MHIDKRRQDGFLFKFAFFSRFEDDLVALANLANKENWGAKGDTTKYLNPILRSYIFHTFSRLKEEQKVSYASNNEYCCFNTGLTDPYYENIFAFFAKE